VSDSSSSRPPSPIAAVGAAVTERRASASQKSLARAGEAHVTDVEELRNELACSASGLTAAEAKARLEEYGENRLPDQTKDPGWLRFLKQFTDPLVLTLLAAAVVAVFVGMSGGDDGGSWLSRFADALAILLIVVLNAVIGFFQERRAEAALDALQQMTAPTAKVRRDGELVEVASALVVPGDILEFEAGDAISADARLLQAIDLSAEESALTGESVPRTKDAMAHIAADAPLADRENMVYTGTAIVRGKGRALVVATGSETELGRIGTMIASIGDQKSPLEERLEAFGKVILWVCLSLSAALLAWGALRPRVFGGEPRPLTLLLLEAVALAVAAIPEGLPAITTITLALGMQRMAKRGAIVRKLPAVETLGAATIICSDKTGTLTQNEMTVRRVYTYGHAYEVTGEGYDKGGEILDDKGRALSGGDLPDPLERLLATAALCNNASLRQDEDGKWKVLGDPTEGALLALAAKGDRAQESVRITFQHLAELPFDSDRKRMTVVTRDARGKVVAHVKGAPLELLERSDQLEAAEGRIHLTDAIRERIAEQAEAMSSKALRVLGLCRREEVDKDGDADTIEEHLTFLGLVGMMDPPRAGVAEAVATCHDAGIRAVMITGDHKLTARAIAEEIGMWEPGDEAITGTELEKMSDDELDEHIMRLRVFARTTPEQKLRIVRAFKRAGHVVAMTGDGVNDAPALREASIGVAMGRMGTDVARQAADLVLSDDNFATIVEAVREGRAIYRNIQKFIFFLLSSNMGLVVAVFTLSLFKRDLPALTPLMVLWINLVTNGAPALALGMDPPDKRLMEEPPRPPREALIVFRDYLGIAYVGAVMGAAAVALYFITPLLGGTLAQARALSFTLLALSPLIHAFSCRSPIRSAFTMRPRLSRPLLIAIGVSAAIHLVAILVPSLQPVFKTFPVSATEWALVLGLAAVVLPAVEIAKLIDRGRLDRMGMSAPPSTMAVPRR
jgi:P-type Ca2+ transporter type 2C